MESKKPARKQAFLNLAPLTGLELHLYLLLLVAFKKWRLFLPSYLPAFLMPYCHKVNYYQLVMTTRFTEPH
ncbi:hypothetical protein E4T96_20965 [Shigella flexneri]|nr:hypothetical protein E4T96_20965 [Shigella flexneri]HAJ7158954.1 hypothetical protein [Escherichia coli]HAJ7169518.1 hypothetical protein [Escherichia coli]HAJ7198637.1 hypothetical protein [Escherichia coli]